ncbi:hypothetical protein C1H46_039183 [Malus baccata]|uniref:Methanol O-anthraniloyltransferase-like n=1 Tax=Malus baccata TaxID=106549 RepID=A0A540KM24_MALBA|nr:hypothetical protein C1H46_039183 [Malus baccata]
MPRESPQVTYMHHEYGDKNESQAGFVIASMDQPDLVQRCFYFGPKEIRAARKLLPPNLTELLCNSPLEYAVELVREAKNKMNEDYIKSVADLLALRGWLPFTLAGNNFILSDNTRTGVREVDFGWGKPIIARPAKSVNLISFYVWDSNQEKDYGILVPMCLPFWCMEKIELELKRITMEPVEVISKQDSNTCLYA